MNHDEVMSVDFSNLTCGRESLSTLQDLKQDIIGGEKMVYFDKGLIETIASYLKVSTDRSVLYECLAILNSFLIGFPQANPVFCIYKDDFT